MPMLANALVVANLVVALATFPDETLLSHGDECNLGKEDCAFSALQRRGVKESQEFDGDAFDLAEIWSGAEIDLDADVDIDLGVAQADVLAGDMLEKINTKLSKMVQKMNEALPKKLKAMDPLKFPPKSGKMKIDEMFGLSSMSIASFKATNVSMAGGEVLLHMVLDASWSKDFLICTRIGRHLSLSQWGGGYNYYDTGGWGGGTGGWGGWGGGGMNTAQPPAQPPAQPAPAAASAASCPTSCGRGCTAMTLDLSKISYHNQKVTAFIEMASKNITKFVVGAGQMIVQGVSPTVNAGWLKRRIITKHIDRKLPEIKAKMSSKLGAKLDLAFAKMLQKKCPIHLGKKNQTASQPASGSASPAAETPQEAPSGGANCAAHPNCVSAKMTGNCCPTDSGVTLGCCQ